MSEIQRFYDGEHIFITGKSTVKKFSEVLPKIVGQLKIQMGRKFFQGYIVGNISDIELEIVSTVWSEKYPVY